MGDFDSKDFDDTNLANRFSALNSNSSLDYANYLFLDDSLFFDDYKITSESYSSEHFPGSDLVDKQKVFGKPGYNSHSLPILPFSHASLFSGLFSIPVLFLTIISLAFKMMSINEDSSFFLYLFTLSIISSFSSLFMGFFALRKPRSRFFRGRKQAQIGILISSICLGILFWVCILAFI